MSMIHALPIPRIQINNPLHSTKNQQVLWSLTTITTPTKETLISGLNLHLLVSIIMPSLRMNSYPLKVHLPLKKTSNSMVQQYLRVGKNHKRLGIPRINPG
jgi:hypothetical protein